MRSLLDVVAPPVCVGCGAVGDAELCPVCAEGVDVLGAPRCDRCGSPTVAAVERCQACRPLDGFSRARSLVAYAEPARSLTLALKRRGRRPLARAIGGLVAGLARANGLRGEVVAYVPAGRRARSAGFDHVQLIARAAADSLGVASSPLLVRAKEGPRQADVALSGRRSNVLGRFVSRPARGSVLLVDDVYTTGATAEACSAALLAAGASSVDVVTWARTLRRRPPRDSREPTDILTA